MGESQGSGTAKELLLRCPSGLERGWLKEQPHPPPSPPQPPVVLPIYGLEACAFSAGESESFQGNSEGHGRLHFLRGVGVIFLHPSHWKKLLKGSSSAFYAPLCSMGDAVGSDVRKDPHTVFQIGNNRRNV